jgi:hypothetical protein
MNAKYCTRSDLVFIKADIGQYDRKASIQSCVTSSGDLRKSANIGQTISMLYRDGIELGSAQSSQGDVDSDGEWYYDSDADLLWLYSSLNPAVACVIELGIDITTLQNEAISRASDFIRAYINKTVLPRKGTNQADATASTYEEIITRSSAILAVSYLVRGRDRDLADYYEKQVVDKETGMGYLDRIKRGDIKLWNEAQERMGEGVVSIVNQNGSSTGSIVDTRGQATVPYDNIKVIVTTGGTFALGSASSIKIDSYISDNTGLQTTKSASNETVDGSYINIGRGIAVRFSAGVYTADDEWSIEVNGDFVTSGAIKTAQAFRA